MTVPDDILKINKKIASLTDRNHPTLSILPNKTANIIKLEMWANAQRDGQTNGVGYSQKVGQVIAEAGRESMVEKICERGRLCAGEWKRQLGLWMIRVMSWQRKMW